jgi:hypothetical protein
MIPRWAEAGLAVAVGVAIVAIWTAETVRSSARAVRKLLA